MTLHKMIYSKEDLDKWIDSPIYSKFVDFVHDLQQSVVGLTNDSPVETSRSVELLVELMTKVSDVADQHPIVKDKELSRFGKPEFREFYDDLKESAPQLLSELLAGKNQTEKDEICAYFVDAWGNRTRIDYGSGHELNFMLFLYCLREIGIVGSADYTALVLKVFCQYMTVMRKLQKTYWLEPAGSHGVWGLDDYHFLPFLFGAAQLSGHAHMRPKSIHNKELVATLWPKYMYFECIHFINSIKTVPGKDSSDVSLRWHSPMLDDISSAKSWSKITDGMVKMYRAEVLQKLPIVQHVMFGELFPAPEGLHEHDEESDCGHVHSKENLSTWGDCCGIKVPSALAASHMNQRVPFD